MTTGYFCKRIAVILTAVYCFSACVYAGYLKRAEKIGEEKAFYFLTTNADSVEACILDVSKNGGAGFLTDCHIGDVALSVYFNMDDAELVCAANAQNYDGLKVCERVANALYIKGFSRKKQSKAIRADFENAYLHILKINEILTGLEKGETQESVKRTLGALKQSFQILSKSAIKELRPFFEAGAEYAAELEKEIVTASALRYFLCTLSSDYVVAAENFSL